MRFLTFLLLSLSLVFGIDHKTDLTIQGVLYDTSKSSAQVQGNTAFTMKDDDFNGEVSFNYLYTSPYDVKYFNLNTLYLAKETKAYTYRIGKIIKHWGALEGFNVTDVFNQKNYFLDPFDKSEKIGSWAAGASIYMNPNNVFEVTIKFHEENQKLPQNEAPFNPLSLPYDDDLNVSSSKFDRTIYVSYSLTADSVVESESTFIVQDGYDIKRYYGMSENKKLVQNAYKCNKYMFFSNILMMDTLLKFEAAYTKIKDNDLMSDYQQLAVGIEKSINDVSGVDIGLYAEYYNYKYKNKKTEQVDISEIYNNDILVATKLNFNDTGSSELRMALLNDLDTKERLLKIDAKTRFRDKFVLSAEYIQLFDTKDSLLVNFKDANRFVAGLTYSF